MGVFLNAYGPIRDGAWLKLARSVALGAPAAAIGGALGLVAGEVVIGLLQGGLLGRALSWAVLGLGIGLGQGIADRSRDRLIYGLIGGGLGGFLGGFLFEWLRVALGDRHDLGQAVGIVTMGAGLGLCLALVEQVLRRAWVQVVNGRQEGRIYLLSHARSAASAWTSAPRSASSATPPWRAGTPRSSRRRAVTCCTAWRPRARRASMAIPSTAPGPCMTAIGSS